MKSSIYIITILFAFISCTEISNKETFPGSSFELENYMDSGSYAIGVKLANEMNARGIEKINQEALWAGLNDAFQNNQSQFTPYQAEQIKGKFYRDQYFKQIMNFKKDGEQFLAKNKKKEGIITTESGLQYEIIVQGDGPKPEENDKVKVHYTGSHLNGDVFDSSIERGEPAEFLVSGVIKGWTEALLLMPVGSKWRIYIPQELGYGANPRPNSPIKPYQALIFEVELLEIMQ